MAAVVRKCCKCRAALEHAVCRKCGHAACACAKCRECAHDGCAGVRCAKRKKTPKQ